MISSNGEGADDHGVELIGAGTSGNTVSGNIIGLDAGGTTAMPNSGDGVLIDVGADGNTIGGASSDQRNIISGHADSAGIRSHSNDNLIRGNYIGTDINGATEDAGNGLLGNGVGVWIVGAVGNTLQENVVSGNRGQGVYISGGDGHTLIGNRIGTDAQGEYAIDNDDDGVLIEDSHTNIVGGNEAAERNVISGNHAYGVHITGIDAADNRVIGNYIGLDADGESAISNFVAVFVEGAPGTIIGDEAVGEGNVIADAAFGVWVSGANATGTQVQGNYIGVDAAGSHSLQTGALAGVLVTDGATNTVVGGPAPGARNVISGNGFGVSISDVTTTGTIVGGNLIGLAADGASAIGNSSDGIRISESSGNTIGDANIENVIAYNGGAGVRIDSGTTNRVSRNSIYANALGIDLGIDGITPNDAGDGDAGPNNLQNFPVISSATVGVGGGQISGALAGAGAGTRIELFIASDCLPGSHGQGKVFLAAVTADAGAGGAFSTPAAISLGQLITATATDALGNTSEFAACLEVVQEPGVDGDGVPDLVESGAPNGGDGNNDGLQDNQQPNVASLPNADDGTYVTLVSAPGTQLSAVQAIDNPSPGNAPPLVTFPIEFVKFNINNVVGATTLTLIDHTGTVHGAYYKFGPLPPGGADQWYNFAYDGTTGARSPATSSRSTSSMVRAATATFLPTAASPTRAPPPSSSTRRRTRPRRRAPRRTRRR